MDKQSIKRSLAELKETLVNRFAEGVELYLFGSVARNDYSPESDIDVLVLLPGEVDTQLKREIIYLGFDIGIKNDVVFNLVSRSKRIWDSKMSAVTPFHQNLEREAILL